MSIRLKAILCWFLTFILFLFILNLSRNLWRLWHAGDRVEEAQEKLEKLKVENVQLQREKERIEKGDFIEEQARNKLFMVKENELVLVLPLSADRDKEKDFVEKELPVNEGKEIWQKWLEIFW